MSKNKEAEDLLEAAMKDGTLSAQSMQSLSGVDLGAQIQAGLGIGVDDVQASEVVLLTMMPDDSGSIAGACNEQLVRDGHNLVLDALAASKSREAVLAHTRYLNGHVLFPYRPLDQAIRMTPQNYTADKGTPLYDQAIVLLGSVVAKTQAFSQSGVMVRSVTLIITDGEDAGSSRKARDVAALVADLRRQECHIVAALGISDGHTDFKKVFGEMGIEDKWILTPGNSASEIRRAFQVFSQSAVHATSAQPTALAGFVS